MFVHLCIPPLPLVRFKREVWEVAQVQLAQIALFRYCTTLSYQTLCVHLFFLTH